MVVVYLKETFLTLAYYSIHSLDHSTRQPYKRIPMIVTGIREQAILKQTKNNNRVYETVI